MPVPDAPLMYSVLIQFTKTINKTDPYLQPNKFIDNLKCGERPTSHCATNQILVLLADTGGWPDFMPQ